MNTPCYEDALREVPHVFQFIMTQETLREETASSPELWRHLEGQIEPRAGDLEAASQPARPLARGSPDKPEHDFCSPYITREY
ncbi:hypothetical protein E2C01_083164 [Portunus trituberculatus]|uniref:Uncharacterized protein n=1 Tax=Portunus trituberculatus TaxID=210409 RepID=A0A5B7J723_PORTR|nr:hypothetical protein [Portunus trituberculatus]